MNRSVIQENDRYSIYSFDSVSTNGRLLDRLDLGDDDDDDIVVENTEDNFDFKAELQSIISDENNRQSLQNLMYDGSLKESQESNLTLNQDLKAYPNNHSINHSRIDSQIVSNIESKSSDSFLPSVSNRHKNPSQSSFTRISGRILEGGTRSHMIRRDAKNQAIENPTFNRKYHNQGSHIVNSNVAHRTNNHGIATSNVNQKIPIRNSLNEASNREHRKTFNVHESLDRDHRANFLPSNNNNSHQDSLNPDLRHRYYETEIQAKHVMDLDSGSNAEFSNNLGINRTPILENSQNFMHKSYSEGDNILTSNDSNSPILSSRIESPITNKIILQNNISVHSLTAGIESVKPPTTPTSVMPKRRSKTIILDESELPSRGSLKEHNLDVSRFSPEVTSRIQIRESDNSRQLSDSSIPFSGKTIIPPKRSLSYGSNQSSQSQSLLSSLIHLHDDMTPEARTKLALQYRNIGKLRDASYQLQIAANPPYNYPRAMYLYSIALKQGQGVKQNERQYLKWLCKCILLYSNPISLNEIVEKLNTLEPEGLIKLILRRLNYDNSKESVKNGQDPFELYESLKKLPKAEIIKIGNSSKSQSDILSVAYCELGNATMYGWGLNTKSEIIGIKLLEKSAGLYYTGAMVQLGEIWSSKSKHYKRDLNRAAAWLRLSELFGIKEIGNSWIYKEKYMKPAKK